MLEVELKNSQDIPYHVGDAKRLSLNSEMRLTNKIRLNIERVRKELQLLQQKPNQYSVQSLLVGNESITVDIKE